MDSRQLLLPPIVSKIRSQRGTRASILPKITIPNIASVDFHSTLFSLQPALGGFAICHHVYMYNR